MENEERNKGQFIALYNKQVDIANSHTSLMWKEINFFVTITLATITIPIALLGIDNIDKILLNIFPFLGIIFSLFGFWSLKHESDAFYTTLYSQSKIREKINFTPLVNKNNHKEYEKIGILHIDFEEYPSVCDYLKANVFRLKSIRTAIFVVYIIFILLNIFLLFYFLSISNVFNLCD